MGTKNLVEENFDPRKSLGGNKKFPSRKNEVQRERSTKKEKGVGQSLVFFEKFQKKKQFFVEVMLT